MKHEKIGPQHLERKAILYVRQSSAHQVLHNRESSTLQYAMRERLSIWAGAGSRPWMTILAGLRPAGSRGQALSG
jgi:hypothetical protein